MFLRIRTLLLVIVSVVMSASAAMPSESSPQPYLALGDSVVFGYITQAGFEYGNPTNFIGFPDYVGRDLRLDDFDAACPGETTGSFLSATAPDNGCRAFRFQLGAPLHVSYGSTQSSFALSFLKSHRRTRLVTILLGANDLFLLEDACAGDATCIADGLPGVLATISTNIATILGEIRATGYKGAIVVENYYSLDYSDASGTAIAQLLNQAIAAPAASFRAVVADVFSAFQAAATFAGGQTCRAGLLNASPQNQFVCDVHPSQSGQRLIARAVDAAFAAALRESEQ